MMPSLMVTAHLFTKEGYVCYMFSTTDSKVNETKIILFSFFFNSDYDDILE